MNANVLKKLLEAFIEDVVPGLPSAIDLNNLKDVVQNTSPNNRTQARIAFKIIVQELEDAINECTHEEVTVPYSGREVCNSCGSYRKREEVYSNGWGTGSYTWSEWTIKDGY